MFGPVDCDGEMTGGGIVYLYPDLVAGLKGSFRKGKMVFGRKIDVLRAWLVKGNLELEVSIPKMNEEPFRYAESTAEKIAEFPLQRDVYESKTVSCKRSRYLGHRKLLVKSVLQSGIRRGTFSEEKCQG